MADEVTLTLPREPEFQRVAHLVLGGLAVRLNLTIENLEDLQLAFDALLDGGNGHDGDDRDLTVQMRLQVAVLVVAPKEDLVALSHAPPAS